MSIQKGREKRITRSRNPGQCSRYSRSRFDEARSPAPQEQDRLAQRQDRDELKDGATPTEARPSLGEAHLLLREIAHLLEAKGTGNEIREGPGPRREMRGQRGNDPWTGRRLAPRRPGAHEERRAAQRLVCTLTAGAAECDRSQGVSQRMAPQFLAYGRSSCRRPRPSRYVRVPSFALRI
jgi:hypothetical protein